MYRKTTSIVVITLVLFTMVVLPAVATATVTLAGDSNAVLHNSTAFVNGLFSGHVDYAVYAPGFYDGSLSLPSNEYVYCYQVFDSPSSTVNIDYFSVGLYPSITVDNLTYDPAHPVAVSGGTNPSFEFPLSQTVLYLFSVSPITPNSHSSVLLFASKDAPTMAFGAVSGGYTGGAVVSLPTPDPIPEPASLLLFSLGIPVLVRFRRRAV